MEEGSLRCDANVSVRRAGAQAFGVKTEIKNLNSFRHVQRALEYEIDRQITLLDGGGRVEHETRLWDPGAARTLSMRSKEDAHDYRYFPEPDLPPLQIERGWIEASRRGCPNCRMRGGVGSSRSTRCPSTMRPSWRSRRHGGVLRGHGGRVRQSQGRKQLDHG